MTYLTKAEPVTREEAEIRFNEIADEIAALWFLWDMHEGDMYRRKPPKGYAAAKTHLDYAKLAKKVFPPVRKLYREQSDLRRSFKLSVETTGPKSRQIHRAA